MRKENGGFRGNVIFSERWKEKVNLMWLRIHLMFNKLILIITPSTITASLGLWLDFFKSKPKKKKKNPEMLNS